MGEWAGWSGQLWRKHRPRRRRPALYRNINAKPTVLTFHQGISGLSYLLHSSDGQIGINVIYDPTARRVCTVNREGGSRPFGSIVSRPARPAASGAPPCLALPSARRRRGTRGGAAYPTATTEERRARERLARLARVEMVDGADPEASPPESTPTST